MQDFGLVVIGAHSGLFLKDLVSEYIFGVGYENCCVALSVTASDRNLSKYLDGLESDSYTYLNDAWDNIITIENKSRINFEFQLKGLNSTFEKVGRLMNNSILNY